MFDSQKITEEKFFENIKSRDLLVLLLSRSNIVFVGASQKVMGECRLN